MRYIKSTNKFSSFLLCFIFSLATATVLVSFKAYTESELLSKLGLTAANADESISNSFFNGSLSFYSASNLRKIATGDRAGIAKELCMHTKAYTNSVDFKTRYSTYREDHKPSEPEASKTEDQVREEYIKGLRDALENMEKVASSFTGDDKSKWMMQRIL